MASLADAVFDAALNYIKSNVNKVQLRNASSAVLVSHASSGSDIAFGSAGDNSGSGGGRKIQCLTGSGLQSIAVSSGGSATKGALLASSTVVAVASTASTYNLGSSDTVNFGTISVILKDPT